MDRYPILQRLRKINELLKTIKQNKKQFKKHTQLRICKKNSPYGHRIKRNILLF